MRSNLFIIIVTVGMMIVVTACRPATSTPTPTLSDVDGTGATSEPTAPATASNGRADTAEPTLATAVATIPPVDNFSVEVSGSSDFVITGAAQYHCVHAMIFEVGALLIENPAYLEVNLNSDAGNLKVQIPVNTEPGTYDVVSASDDATGREVTATLFQQLSFVEYGIVDSGSVTLDEISNGPGQVMKGSVKATLSTADGSWSVSITAEFDFTTPVDLSELEIGAYYCPFQLE